MEIHELNTFTGSPGANDYLATDNGVDTSKISIPTITDPLNARIDNIITSPAPSAEEIIDARLGANGFAYPSLGDAIRGQFTDIQRVVNDGFMPEVDYVTADCSTQTSSADSGTHNGVTWTRISGTEWKANGTASSAGSFRNLIGSTSTVSTRFYAGQKLKINVSTTSPSLVLRVYCYTESNPGGYSINLTEDSWVKIPKDITGFLVRVAVFADAAVSNATLSFSITGYYESFIESTNDTTDRTEIIRKILGYTGYVRLGTGIFYLNNLNLIPGETLTGEGNQTVIRLADSGDFAIGMANRCKVENVRIIGADEDIVLPDSSFVPQRGDINLIPNLTWDVRDGYIRAILPTALPAGTYQFEINNVQSDNLETDYFYVSFLDQDVYSTTHISAKAVGEKNASVKVTVDPGDREIKSIYIFASDTAAGSAGYNITLNSQPKMYTLTSAIGNRFGIKWYTETSQSGVISDCLIERFDGAGILAMDSGTPVDNNVNILNCFVRNCAVGVYMKRDAEFIRVCNCTITRNYYGVLNRGGNNNIANCGIDGNVVNVQIDADEGSNNGHGAITGCSLNHADNNNGYGLIVKDTGRMVVSNCNFYYAKVKLSNTNGNVITGCGFGNAAGWEVEGGTCNIFNGCMVKNWNSDGTSVTITDNTKTKIVNCFNRNGTEYSA